MVCLGRVVIAGCSCFERNLYNTATSIT
jgi:hypothetical protein